MNSKNKIKPNGYHSNKKDNDQLDILEENAFEIDKEELDRTIQQIQDERYFHKEFAKDLKKFSKLQNQILEKKDKKMKRHLNKNELLDSYIEGDIELVDFITQMDCNKKDKKNKSNRRGSNRRLSEMFRKKTEPSQKTVQ